MKILFGKHQIMFLRSQIENNILIKPQNQSNVNWKLKKFLAENFFNHDAYDFMTDNLYLHQKKGLNYTHFLITLYTP